MKRNLTIQKVWQVLPTMCKWLSNHSVRKGRTAIFILMMLAPALAFSQGVGRTVGGAGGFEVDANFYADTIPSFWTFTGGSANYIGGKIFGDDWSKKAGATHNAVLLQSGGVSVPGTNFTPGRRAIWQVDGNWGSDVPEETSVFAGTSNKNGDPIGLGQSPYSTKAGSGGPQKNDITNVFLHARRHPTTDDLWIFFGAETRSINGSSYLDLEYNQAGVRTDSGDLMIGLGPVGGRTVDDILLIVNYTKGGSNPIVSVRKWLPDATWSNKLTITPGNEYVTTNTQDIEAVAPLAGYEGDGTPSSTTLAYQFVEGALNVTALGLSGVQSCAPNATVTVKTRSSSSYTSELKDWSVLHFPLTPDAEALVNNITPQCRDLSGTNVFNVTGTYANGNPTWSSSGGVLSNQMYVDGNASATLTVTAPTSSVSVTLTTTSTNIYCPPAMSTKTAVIKPYPVGSASPQTICSGGTTNIGLTADSAGTTFTWTAAIQTTPSGGTITGFTNCASSCGSTIAQTLTNTGTTFGVVRYTVTPTFNGCPGATFTVDARVNPVPVVNQPGNQVVCNGDATAAINFTGTAATSYDWTNNTPSIGLASSGSGNIASFSAVNNGSTKVTATITVTPKYTGGGVTCTGTPKMFTIIVNPTPTVNQPGNQSICQGTNTTAVNFSGTGATSFQWTNDNTSIGLGASGTGNIAAFTGINNGATPQVANITVTPYYNGDGKECVGTPKMFTITVNPKDPAPTTTYIPPTCVESTFKVQITNPVVGSTYKLTQLDGNMVTIGPYVSGDLIFSGLHVGQSYSVISTTAAGCTSNPGVCADAAPPAETPRDDVQTSASKTVIIKDDNSKKPSVIAAPNPFSDKIRFVITAPESGKGSLELFNTLGQKVQTVFQGNLQKGSKRTIDYTVPYAQRSNLIYVFRMGETKLSGTLIGLK